MVAVCQAIIEQNMTIEEIREAADMAAKWPGVTALNFGELPFKALAAWVALNP